MITNSAEVVMETTFPQTRLIKRGAETNKEAESDSSDSEILYAERKIMRQQIKPRGDRDVYISGCNL